MLEPLGPEHNESDFAAWSSSIEHVRSTPGYGGERDTWPQPMTLAQNLDDLVRHRHDFEACTGFTYTVLDPADRAVIGCVYIYPSRADGHDAAVHSWVRADRARLDVEVWRAVSGWLATDWPFEAVDYAPREER